MSDASLQKHHQHHQHHHRQYLNLVVCNEYGIDDTQKVFGFFTCDKPVKLNLNYAESLCNNPDCEFHICAPVVLKNGGSKRIVNNQKTLWYVFYHDWNMGDLFDPDYHPVCGAYVSKDEALQALKLPSNVIPPGNEGGTDSNVTPNELEGLGVNGEFYCREYRVWDGNQK